MIDRVIPAHSLRLATVALLLALLGREVVQVEDGQFEREYSRLYTMIVVGMGAVLVLAVLVLLLRGARALIGE